MFLSYEIFNFFDVILIELEVYFNGINKKRSFKILRRN